MSAKIIPFKKTGPLSHLYHVPYLTETMSGRVVRVEAEYDDGGHDGHGRSPERASIRRVYDYASERELKTLDLSWDEWDDLEARVLTDVRTAIEMEPGSLVKAEEVLS